MMNHRLDHIALNCANLDDAVNYYETILGGKATAVRKAGKGNRFRFIEISGSAPMEMPPRVDASAWIRKIPVRF